ncbi:MAG: zinc ribbon domain-containing protein [Tannerella sp.]|jgi:predicted nucleic acid-binding Zn ribbon protein|nr:zinc ribbon domain-containing protein [Tannerella sp.]
MGLLDGLVKGLANIIPEEGNPELKTFKAQQELKEIATKEDRIFARLGKQVYADGGSEKYPDIKTELDALAASRQEIEGRLQSAKDETEAKKKAEEAEEARRCPECGTVNPENAAFCQSCGNRMPQAKRFCPQCGSEIPQGNRFCNECGTKIESITF